METYILIGLLAVALLISLAVQWFDHKRLKTLENYVRYKPTISILLCFLISILPSTAQTVQQIEVPAFGQVELPANIPQNVQDQIQIILASQDGLLSWTETFLAIAIVIVAGVILYCLWKCAKKLDEVPPQPKIPDDPAFAEMPSVVVYNMTPAMECKLEGSTDLIKWTTLCMVTNSNEELPVPSANRMFFRLEPVE